jgi:hypothetical protein
MTYHSPTIESYGSVEQHTLFRERPKFSVPVAA